MRNFIYKLTLGLLVILLFGCATVRSFYDVEESFGTAAEAYKALVEEEQKERLGRP